MANFERIITIVTDSAGIGAAPDAAKYGDAGADTYGHISAHMGPAWHLPHLEALGLGNIRAAVPMVGLRPVAHPAAAFGKMAEVSVGKDSMDGHWEMMGLPVTEPLGFFPNGFPTALLKQIANYAQRPIIVNRPYSGTDVIHDYGAEQLRTGALIVYTSGDSVLQIAANIDLIDVPELYRICEFTRSITREAPYRIGRVIVRPFTYIDADHFTRTSDRHDYALLPPRATALDRLQAAHVPTYGIGKINDIFSGQGLGGGVHTVSNDDGMVNTIQEVAKGRTGFIFTNLVDFDAMYGHRRNPAGYATALSRFDDQLGVLMEQLQPTDLLLITSDHGNDPTYQGTDHTREFVPLLAYSPALTGGVDLGTRTTFSDLGATICANWDVAAPAGQPFLKDLK